MITPRSTWTAALTGVASLLTTLISKATKKDTLLLFSVAVLLAGGAAAVRGQSALDGFDPNANGAVQVAVIQPDGKILIGGDFTMLSPNGGAAVMRNHIARLNPDGTLDTAFDPNANNTVLSIAVQADGKILAGGLFTNIGGAARNFIARLDAATGAVDSFDPNANSFVASIAVQADGKILAGGQFNSIGGATRNLIARLNPTTGVADSFDPNADGVVYAIALQADGKILTGGVFTSIGGATRNRIARLDPTTGLADSFDPNASGLVYAIALQADGKILAGGVFTSIGGATRNRIARLDPTTGAADSFNPNPSNPSGVKSIAVQADGKILAGGQFTNIGGSTRNNIARLETDGGLDQTLDLNTLGTDVVATAVQADGKILIGGGFTSVLGVARNNIARLNSDGTLDTAFNPNANNLVLSIAVQADGEILAVGEFTSIGGATRNFIARLDPTTGVADSFNPNANHNVLVNRGAGGRQDFSGRRVSPTSAERRAIASPGSILPQESLIRSTRTRTILSLSIAVQADGKILAGGQFTSIGGATRNKIARLDPTTGVADSFNPNANNFVESIAVQTDGKILAGGGFTSIGGQMRSLFARLSNDTAALQSLAVTQSTITWTRDGSSPQFARVTFEFSTDTVHYALLGKPTAVGSNWIRTSLKLSTGKNLYIRTRGYYPSGQGNASESITESVWNVLIPTPATVLANISTRLQVETGDNVLIGGIIITGSQPKKIIIRAIGPSLPFTDQLADPILDLHDSTGALLETNDNWMDSPNKQAIIDSTIPPSNPLESAIVRSLAPGAYTAVVRGVNDGTGIGVVEAYDLDTAANSKLANISTRGLVQGGDNVLIAGTIVVGQTSQKVIIRALGPSLSVPGKLADPTLELHDGNGALLEANDNWVDSPNKQAIIDSTIPPTNDLESAIVRTLTPASYTAIVRSANNTTGIAVVEVYALQ